MTIVKDLRPIFLPARDQGPRPTCVAFAVSDAHASVRPPHTALSPEYLYYFGVQRTAGKDPENGISVVSATDALATEGQPIESDCPYRGTGYIDPHWSPLKCVTFRANGHMSASGLADVRMLLDRDIPSILIMRLSIAFYSLDASGFMDHTLISDQEIPGFHAVVATGYGNMNGMDYVLLRNSWGSGWGASGYGWFREDYLHSRILSSTSLVLQS
jgi:C1A family cysteine protease